MKGEVGIEQKKICRSKYDTHKIKLMNRVKGKNLISNLWAQPRVENCARKLATIRQNTNDKTNVFKIESCGSSGQFPTRGMIQKVCRFLSEIGSFESLRSCSQ
jgi:hypothetical protein